MTERHFRLNEGEVVLGGGDVDSVVFDRGGFILTSQRVINVKRSPLGAEATIQSFTLENLDSVRSEYSRAVGCAVIAVLAVAVALMNFVRLSSLRRGSRAQEEAQALIVGSIFVAIVGLLIYALSKRARIVLMSGRSEIVLDASGMSYEGLQQLAFDIEQAKQARLDRLASGARGSPVRPRLTAERLQELESLKAQRLISEAEYAASREAIIKSLVDRFETDSPGTAPRPRLK